MTPHTQRQIWLDHVRGHVQAGLLNNHASHIAHILATHYMNTNNEAWPTQQTLARTAGVSERTTRRAIHDLEQHHLLETRKGAPATRFGNVYKLSNPAPQAGLNGRQPGTTGRVDAQRDGVTPNALTPSDLYVSPLSIVGDQVLNGSSGLWCRVRRDP